MEVRPTDDQLNELYAWAMNEAQGGATHYAGMTYEDGIKAVIDWLQGNVNAGEIKGE